jgi:hypothetical protein
MKLRTHLPTAALVIGFAMTTQAAEIRWTANDTFAHTLTVAPGKSAELCGPIEPRLPVEWHFSADGPLDFNVHRHSGDEVIFATKSFLTREQKGKLAPTFGFEWCWMWTNASTAPVTVQVDLNR